MANPTRFSVIGDWIDTEHDTFGNLFWVRSRAVAEAVMAKGEFVLHAGDAFGTNIVSHYHPDTVDGALAVWSPYISPAGPMLWGSDRRPPGARFDVDGTYERQPLAHWPPGNKFDDKLNRRAQWSDNGTRWFHAWGNHDYDETAGEFNHVKRSNWFVDDWIGRVSTQLPVGFNYQADDPYENGTSENEDQYGRNEFWAFDVRGEFEVCVVNNVPSDLNYDGYEAGGPYRSDAGSGTKWIYDKVQTAPVGNWRFVLGHYPMYSSGKTGQDTSTAPDSGVTHSGRLWRAFMQPAINASNYIPVMLGGHDHHTEICYFIDSSGRKNWHITVGSMGGDTSGDAQGDTRGTGGAAPLDMVTVWRQLEDGSGASGTGKYWPTIEVNPNYLKVDIWKTLDSDIATTTYEATVYILKEGAMAYAVLIRNDTVRVFHGPQDTATDPDVVMPVTGLEKAVGIMWKYNTGAANSTVVVQSQFGLTNLDDGSAETLTKDLKTSSPDNRINTHLGTIGNADGICWPISGQGYDLTAEAAAACNMSHQFKLVYGAGTTAEWDELISIYYCKDQADAFKVASALASHYGV